MSRDLMAVSVQALGLGLRPGVVYRHGPLTAEDYDEAIEALQSARLQLQPDGNGCRVCWDSGHQAWECRHNPLVMARRAARRHEEWRCYHCGAVFNDHKAAFEHFGEDETVLALCLHEAKALTAIAEAANEYMIAAVAVGPPVCDQKRKKLFELVIPWQNGRAKEASS